MSQRDEARGASPRRRSSSRRDRRRSQRQSDTTNDKESSSADKPSPGSWTVDRGRSRTRRPSNPVSEDNLRRRGYHTLYSSFGKVFHVEKRWKMIRDMGSGAYGVVISAADEISGETVAIKLVTRVFDKISLAKRALREITLLRHFANHENITGLIDVDAISKDFNEIYLFMEPMEADLHQIIRSGQTLTNEHVQYFVYQILRGMKYIHSASVVHRDLKPGNLLVNADCELKICDFGLSRGFDARPDENATHMTEYVATRWYRAPEIMLAFHRYNTAIDVWSIGCILAELILGRPLFRGKDYVDQLNKILDVLGTPDEDVIKKIGSDKAQAYVRSLPYRKQVPFRKLMPSADPQALDLLEKMLSFDPSQRITVPEALKHPWLSSYHDVNDEPDCATPYEKWREIEKLETIEQFREALWNEIEEYRREVRSINLDLAAVPWSHLSQRNHGGAYASAPQPQQEPVPTEMTYAYPHSYPEVFVREGTEETAVAKSPAELMQKEIILCGDDRMDEDATSTTAIPSIISATATSSESATATATGTNSLITPSMHSALRPSLERRDSNRPPTPPGMANDPVISYARRSSILQAQYHHQQGSTSVSPSRQVISGLPPGQDDATVRYYAPFPSQVREASGAPLPIPTPPPGHGHTISASIPGMSGMATGIPFPSASGGSYILPARSRTASMAASGEFGSGFYAGRKLLRTLSTVSIHESVEGLAGGLAAMGPIGQAIIERRETAADAPPSEMPREFDAVKEEEEGRSGSGSGGQSGRSGKLSSGSSSDGDRDGDGLARRRDGGGSGSAKKEGGGSGRNSDSASKESLNGNGAAGIGTPVKKKERRFILF